MSDTPIVSPTPQARFKEIPKAINEHRDLMQMPRVQRALDYAMLEFQKRLLDAPISQASQFTHFRLLGAQEFIEVFRTIAETPKKFEPQTVDRLNHGV